MKKIIYCLVSVLCLMGCQPSHNAQLIEGIYLEDPSQVRQALKRGADPSIYNKSSNPLAAVYHVSKNKKIEELLLQHGATPLDY